MAHILSAFFKDHPTNYARLDKSHWLLAIDPPLFTTSHSYTHDAIPSTDDSSSDEY